jgi:hypothetical protein
MDVIPDAAARTRIRALDDSDVELKQLWAEKPVVLAFVRHFG